MIWNFRQRGRIASRDQSGSVGIIFALTVIPAIMFVGSAVDYARALQAKEALQKATDAAALGATSATGAMDAQRITLATAIFNANFNSSKFGQITPKVSSASGVVAVSATADVAMAFMKLAHVDTISVSASSKATVSVSGGPAVCMLALSPYGSDAIHVQGTNNLTATDCWAWANSNSNLAITGSGGAIASANGFCAVGNFSDSGNYQPTPRTSCNPLQDPYATLAGPPTSGCTYNNKKLSSGNYSLYPGVYCGGLEIKPQATGTFAPGIYVMKDGPLLLQGGSTASGDGVVFYFTGSNSTLQLKGGANAALKAPASGTYGGFLFIQDRASSVGATSQIQGGGSIQINGVLYMPTQTLNVGGNGDFNLTGSMFALVADSFYLQGNGTLGLKSDYTGAGLPDVLPKAGSVRLIN